MKIMTWNINRFGGVWDWYKEKKDSDESCRRKIAEKIISYLVQSIPNEDDVVVLQEFPCYGWDDGKIIIECDEYTKWESLFKEKGLKVLEPYGKGLNRTVAVVPNKERIRIWKKAYGDDCKISFKDGYYNKYIELSKELKILGIHLTSSSVLLPSLYGMGESDRPDLILGDFNSGDYVIGDRWDAGREYERQQYRKLINEYGYTDICGGVITDHVTKSSIDHCLIKDSVLIRYEIENVYVEENKKDLSDHYPIIAEIKKKF